MRALRRMRFAATGLLVAMACVFILSTYYVQQVPVLAYARAFAEAAMVGACADWFAVTALFRRPFGLPIPHTAIVPRNKARIGQALGQFMSAHFLTPEILRERLAAIDGAGYAARYLSRPVVARHLSRRGALILPRVLEALPREEVNSFLARLARRGAEAIPAAPFASKLLKTLWAHGETEALIDRAIVLAEASLQRNKASIKGRVAKKTLRWVPDWVDALIADAVLNGLQRMLGEMRDKAHPWRVDLAATVDRLINDLASDPGLQARAEAIKAEILANPVVREQVALLWDEIEARLDKDGARFALTLAEGLKTGLLALTDWVKRDEQVRAAINTWLNDSLVRLIAPRRDAIGGAIAGVVERWDTETLVDRLELQVGRDLQYIRINGTLVGGLAGLAIFAATRWFAGL